MMQTSTGSRSGEAVSSGKGWDLVTKRFLGCQVALGSVRGHQVGRLFSAGPGRARLGSKGEIALASGLTARASAPTISRGDLGSIVVVRQFNNRIALQHSCLVQTY